MAHDQAVGQGYLGVDHDLIAVLHRPVERVDVVVLEVPTERPESDGTLAWSSTTMVVVTCSSQGMHGLGYTYATPAVAAVVRDLLAPRVLGAGPMAIPALHVRMLEAIRNQGRAGVVAAAISAVDVALWDLKARLLAVPLADLLGAARDRVPVYASGGFTSSTLDELAAELERYIVEGHRRVKIKIGRDPRSDVDRVRVARAAIGPYAELMVDANGAYQPPQACAFAERFAEYGVTYFEEPVSSDDLEGLRFVREHAPPGMAIAAGEYGYDSFYFRRMLEAGAVDILQADATRCLGITGFLRADALCDARNVPLSAHCAPALHLHPAMAATRLVHVEAFRDHRLIEALLLDGAPRVVDGASSPELRTPGHGLVLRRAEAARFAL